MSIGIIEEFKNLNISDEVEVWKNASEKYYTRFNIQVSNFGRVKDHTGSIINLKITDGKYTFEHNNIDKCILSTFRPIENYDKYMIIHKDGNKLNDRLSNLFWSCEFYICILELSEEKWIESKELDGFFGSDKGKVYSVRSRTLIKTICRDTEKRLCFRATINTIVTHHHLDLFIYFLFNPLAIKNNKYMITYKNGNFSDCSISNLCYVLRNPNAAKIGNIIKNGENKDIENEEEVEEFDNDTNKSKDNTDENKIIYSDEELKKETWKKLPLNENYRVSTLGRIMNKNQEIRKLIPNREGYVRISIPNKTKDSDGTTHSKIYAVHRLVLITFNPTDNYQNMEVNHKNGCKSDNRLINLEWSTKRENMKHAHESGLMTKFRGIIHQIDLSTGNVIKKYDSTVEISKECKIGQKRIADVLNGKIKSINGYYWKYSDLFEIKNNEEIKDIFLDGEKTNYKVSNLGRVVSYHKNVPRILSTDSKTDRYRTLSLRHNGESYMFYLHQLVAEYFISNPNNYKQVHHKDENILNNCSSNLDWISGSDNVKASVGNGKSKELSDSLYVNKLMGVNYKNLVD